MNQLLEIAIQAAKDAGAAVLEHYASTDFEIKNDGSPVTIADNHSNEILLAHLSKTHIPILSEESAGVPLPYPSQLWIIDPLDGTKDFIKKNGDFAVMIGLLEHGHPTLGVVYAPAYNELFYAEDGNGAYCIKDSITTPLSVSLHTENQIRCIRSINHFTPQMAHVAEKLNASLHPRGSIGIKAGVLAQGNGEYFASHGNFGEWDVCAPEIIVREAGGRVTDCRGEALTYGAPDHRLEHGIIFASNACYSRVLEAVTTTSRAEVESV